MNDHPRPLIFVLIVAACGVLDIALQMAGGNLMPMPSAFSPLVDRFGFGVVVTVWIAPGMGLAFLFWARRMAGSGWHKGLRYGVGAGLMILIAMFEGVGLLGTPLIGELAIRSDMPRSDRLLRVIQHLRTEPAPVTAARLAELSDVSERAIYPDIAALRSAGVVIDGQAGYGYTLTEDSDLPPQIRGWRSRR